MENHGLSDFRHQLQNQLLVKYVWFQVRLSNTKVISWLFGRMVNTLPIVTVDRSMHNCPMLAPRGIILTAYQTGTK